jgi:methanogenic corrinoid protein MtbC1
MEQLRRRDFLRKLMRSAPVAAGAAAVTATAIKAQDKVDPALASLKAGMQTVHTRVRQLDERLDALEERQRKWVRVAVGAAALSLGIDVGALF